MAWHGRLRAGAAGQERCAAGAGQRDGDEEEEEEEEEGRDSRISVPFATQSRLLILANPTQDLNDLW